MKRPDSPSTPEKSSGGTFSAAASIGGIGSSNSSNNNESASLSSSLQELLRATDQTIPQPSLGHMNAPPSDLELLLLLQRQRERLVGVNSLFMQQQQQQQQQLLPYHHELLLLQQQQQQQQQQQPSLSILAGAQSGHQDGAFLEAVLALQRQRHGDNATMSANAGNVNNLSSLLSASNMQQQQQQQSQEDQLAGLPAEFSAVLNARIKRSQEQQQLAAQKNADEGERTASVQMSTADTDKTDDNSSSGESDSDKSNENDEGEEDAPEGTDKAASSSEHENADFPVNDTFPYKLFRMLENAERQGQEAIVSFAKEGRAFIIHKPEEFVGKIMPHYFTTSRMTSFQRQLNLYGFRRIADGPDKGAYYHKYFIRGRRKLCKKIKRKKNHPKPPPVFMNQQGGQSLRGSFLMQANGGSQGSALGASLPQSAGVSDLAALRFSSLPPSMSNLLHQESNLGLSPALLELRRRQLAQSDLVRLLLQQQQEQQRQQQQQGDMNSNPFQRFFPPNL